MVFAIAQAFGVQLFHSITIQHNSGVMVMHFVTKFVFVFALMTLVGCQSAQNTSADNNLASSSAAALEPNTATMWVHGMGCPQCAYNVDLQLLKVPGVESVKVDMSDGKVTAKLSPDNPPTKEQLAQAIDKTGFTLKRIEMR